MGLLAQPWSCLGVQWPPWGEEGSHGHFWLHHRDLQESSKRQHIPPATKVPLVLPRDGASQFHVGMTKVKSKISPENCHGSILHFLFVSAYFIEGGLCFGPGEKRIVSPIHPPFLILCFWYRARVLPAMPLHGQPFSQLKSTVGSTMPALIEKTCAKTLSCGTWQVNETLFTGWTGRIVCTALHRVDCCCLLYI